MIGLFRIFHTQICRTPLYHTQLCHTHTNLSHTQSFTHTQVCHTPLCHTPLGHTHTILSQTQLCHTPLCHKHATLSHTQIFHTQLCHTHKSFTHTTLSHRQIMTNLAHTQLCHTQSFLTQLCHTHTQTLAASTFLLGGRRGTYGTGLDLVARLVPVGRPWRRATLRAGAECCCKGWVVSRRTANRLRHALNGNG